MLKTLTLAAAVVALTPLSAGATPARQAAAEAVEGVTLAPRFEQGDRLEYDFEYRSTVGRVGNEAATESVTQRGTLRLNVLGVNEAGAAAMTLIFAELHIEPDTAEEDVEAARKRADEIAAAMKDAVVRLDVQADGTVSAVSGLDEVHKIVGRHGRQAWPLLGPFAGEHAAESLTDLFRVDTREEEGFAPRQVGDSWAIANERPLAQSTVLRTRTVWSLDDVAEDAAALRADINRTMGSTESGNPAAATLAIADQAGTLTARWSVAEGRLIDRLAESQLDVRAAVGDLEGPIVRASTSLQVRFVEPAASEQAAAGVAP